MTRLLELEGEGGAALVLALVFLSLFGIAVSTLLGFADAGARSTIALRSQAAAQYSADGGVDAAINAIRGNASYGRDPVISGASCPSTTIPGTNGLSVTVTCQGESGSGTGSVAGPVNTSNTPALSILTLGTASGEDGIAQTSSAVVNVHDMIFSNSTIRNSAALGTTAIDGSVSAIGNCSGTITSTSPPLRCANTGGGALASDGVNPGWTSGLSSVPTLRTVPSCGAGWLVTFTPGFYNDAVALTSLMNGGCSGKVFWFQPGTYYFDFRTTSASHVWTIANTSANVVGGTPKGWSTSAGSRPTIPAPGSCALETDPTPNTGIQFVFGGDSRVSVTAGTVELCATPSATSQEIAIYGLSSGTPSSSSTTLTAASATSTTFGTPANGRVIDTVVSSASLSSSNTTPILTLSSFSNPIPAGSLITAVTARIAHGEASPANISSLSATITPGDGSAPVTIASAACATAARITLGSGCTAIHTDSIDLTSSLTNAAQFAGISVAYKATRNTSSSTEKLDGLVLDVTYSPPVLETESGCITLTPFPTVGCALLAISGSASVVYVQGTLYAPLAAVSLAETNVSSAILRRGIVGRTIQIAAAPAAGFTGPLITKPDPTIVTADRRVEFVAEIAGSPVIRSVATFADGGGSTPGQTVTLNAWSVLR